MKRKLVFVAIVLLQIVNVMAQDKYESILSSSRVWTLNSRPVVDPNLHSDLYYIEEMKLNGDTIIDGIHFAQIYHRKCRNDQVMTKEWFATNIFIGQDGGKVYQYFSSAPKMRLDMDLSLQTGDKFDCQFYSNPKDTVLTFVVTAASDTILESSTDKKVRRCIHILSENYPKLSEIWIEGIGSLKYGLLGFTYYFEMVGAIPKMIKCVDDDMILYKYDVVTDIKHQKFSKNVFNNTIYDLNGRKMRQPRKGIYIHKGKKQISK